MNSTFGRWLFGIRDLPAGAEEIRLAWERPFEGWVWVLVVIGEHSESPSGRTVGSTRGSVRGACWARSVP